MVAVFLPYTPHLASATTQIVVSLACLIVCRLAIAERTIDQKAAKALDQSLKSADMSRKEAAAIMRMDENLLGRWLRADPSYHMSLTRLLRLPVRVWLEFWPRLGLIVARDRAVEFAEVFRHLRTRRSHADAIEAVLEGKER